MRLLSKQKIKQIKALTKKKIDAALLEANILLGVDGNEANFYLEDDKDKSICASTDINVHFTYDMSKIELGPKFDENVEEQKEALGINNKVEIPLTKGECSPPIKPSEEEINRYVEWAENEFKKYPGLREQASQRAIRSIIDGDLRPMGGLIPFMQHPPVKTGDYLCLLKDYPPFKQGDVFHAIGNGGEDGSRPSVIMCLNKPGLKLMSISSFNDFGGLHAWFSVKGNITKGR